MALNIGDVIFNEFVSDNNTSLSTGNDYFELLVLTDGADLRGLRVSDNELTATSNGALNINESVYTFGQDSYLQSVAKGTVIAVYTNPLNLSVQTNIDTTASAAAGDWKLVLQDGSGITISNDGLGGGVNPGLSTTGEGLYLYLPGADGNSAGTDNVYLDYISYGTDSAEAPTGLVDLNLPDSGSTTPAVPPALPQADEGYYIGNTAAGNDLAVNWVTYDVGAAGAPNAIATPGEANVGQDLSGLRMTMTPPTNNNVVEAGDFDGNGASDILWRDSANGDVYIQLTNGTQGTVRAAVPLAYQIAGTGDFNGDNKSDILFRNNVSGEVYMYQMDGLAVTSEASIRTVSLDYQIAGTGDFNGDNKSDILWRNNVSGDIYIYQMDGFAVANEGVVRTAVPLDYKIAGTGDFNGDNKSDILFRNSVSGEVYIYQMDGFSITNEAPIRTVTNDWVIEGVDDFNMDGNSDLLWRNTTSGLNYIYNMNGFTVANEGFTNQGASLDWKIAGTGDFNSDAKGDVLWRNDNGSTYLWNMNNFNVLAEGSLTNPAGSNWQIAGPTI
jgi:hypothetical protein